MKAARVHGYGDIDTIKYDEVPKPSAGPGQILVKIEASSLNPVESYVRQGFLAQMIPLTFHLSWDLISPAGLKPSDLVLLSFRRATE
jgi:NADPH:quinone reductase-like Zn-dependent oxidoreductase